MAARALAEPRDRAAPRLHGEPAPRRTGATPLRVVRDPVSIQPEEFRAELACSQASPEREPYEEGFGAYAAAAGLADNPYGGDNCAHQQWANGWSQARDQAQRQAR
jgi:hypothetical protein